MMLRWFVLSFSLVITGCASWFASAEQTLVKHGDSDVASLMQSAAKGVEPEIPKLMTSALQPVLPFEDASFTKLEVAGDHLATRALLTERKAGQDIEQRFNHAVGTLGQTFGETWDTVVVPRLAEQENYLASLLKEAQAALTATQGTLAQLEAATEHRTLVIILVAGGVLAFNLLVAGLIYRFFVRPSASNAALRRTGQVAPETYRLGHFRYRGPGKARGLRRTFPRAAR
jgi:hypothetical protein